MKSMAGSCIYGRGLSLLTSIMTFCKRHGITYAPSISKNQGRYPMEGNAVICAALRQNRASRNAYPHASASGLFPGTQPLAFLQLLSRCNATAQVGEAARALDPWVDRLTYGAARSHLMRAWTAWCFVLLEKGGTATGQKI